MSAAEMLAADLVLRALTALCVLGWTPIFICWALCFVAWIRGYPDSMTMADVIDRLISDARAAMKESPHG